MATLNVNLKLTSTDISNNEVLSLDVSSPTGKLSVTDPFIGLAQVAATTTGNETIILSSHSSIRYLYLKHTGVDASGSNATATLQVEIENGKSFAELGADEFLFVPIGQNSGSVAVQLEASSGTIVAEYAFFTKV